MSHSRWAHDEAWTRDTYSTPLSLFVHFLAVVFINAIRVDGIRGPCDKEKTKEYKAEDLYGACVHWRGRENLPQETTRTSIPNFHATTARFFWCYVRGRRSIARSSENHSLLQTKRNSWLINLLFGIWPSVLKQPLRLFMIRLHLRKKERLSPQRNLTQPTEGDGRGEDELLTCYHYTIIRTANESSRVGCCPEYRESNLDLHIWSVI